MSPVDLPCPCSDTLIIPELADIVSKGLGIKTINTSFSVTHTEFTLSDLVHPLQGDPTGSQPSYKNSNMFTPTYNTPSFMSPICAGASGSIL